LYRSPTAYHPQINEAIRIAKQLLEAGLRAKRMSVADPDQRFNAIDVRSMFAIKAVICRNFFLSDSFLRLRAWEPVPVLKLWQCVHDAARSDAVCDWDMVRLETVITEFVRVCRPSEPATANAPPVMPPAAVEEPRLPRRLDRAYRILCAAVEALKQDRPASAITKRSVWNWIKEHAPDGYEHPVFETWERYIRDVPTVFDQQKRARRAVPRQETVARRDEH
jgi:hypothetical protein